MTQGTEKENGGASPKKRKPNRKVEILKAMVEMLQSPQNKRITTKELAAHLNLSEAALYRHFPSKSQMFEALISSVESTLMGFINQVESENSSGLKQIYDVSVTLLGMCRTQPGIPILLVGDFLSAEDPALYQRIETVLGKLRGRLRQSLRIAAAQNEVPPNYNIDVRSDLALALILGQWSEFCKTGKAKNEDLLIEEVKVVLSP